MDEEFSEQIHRTMDTLRRAHTQIDHAERRMRALGFHVGWDYDPKDGDFNRVIGKARFMTPIVERRELAEASSDSDGRQSITGADSK